MVKVRPRQPGRTQKYIVSSRFWQRLFIIMACPFCPEPDNTGMTIMPWASRCRCNGCGHYLPVIVEEK